MSRFSTAYNDAITSIRRMRGGNTPFMMGTRFEAGANCLKRKGGKNKSSLPKKPKPSSWTHKFVCLATTNEDRVPTSCMKDLLAFAGLGEQKVFIPDVDCTIEEFYETLYESFPRLRKAGGFELLRCLPSTRDLEIIPSPVSQSPRLLRSRMSTARVYIRPIQRNLDIDKVDLLEDIEVILVLQLSCNFVIVIIVSL